ncbi:hypothetical protein QYM36_003452 [Artemia franciscana]|uniref:Uncharacterized protein n=1 Tax=Artemia franciscana TaxID=6661 RepID=A0AA88L8M8_ARTSF|nr:hypothetical protein QYM36_003452 [Artemia franciscana]
MDVQQPSINWNAHNLDSEWTHATLIDRGREIFKTFDIPVAKVDKIAAYIKNLKDYAAPKRNQVSSRYGFQKREQLKQKIWTNSLPKLRYLVKVYGYTEESEMIQDKILCSIKNTKIYETLLADDDQLTLKRAITLCRTMKRPKCN